MDFLEKLNLLMNAKNLNKNSLSKLSGIPYTTIDGWYKKGYESMQLSTLKKLSKFFNTTLDFWAKDSITDSNYEQFTNFELKYEEIQHIEKYRKLDTYGKEAVNNILSIEEKRCLDQNLNIKVENNSNVLKIPLADASLSAGTGNLLLTDSYELIEVDGNKYPNADVAFRVKGDSMEPDYLDGDIVYIHKQPTINVGEIGAFLYDDEQYIKQLIKIDGVYKLHSLNKGYEDIEIKRELITYGKVIN